MSSSVELDNDGEFINTTDASKCGDDRVVNEQIQLNDLNFIAVLSQGRYGKVLLAESKKNSNDVFAVKAFKKKEIIQNAIVKNVAFEKHVMQLCVNCPILPALHLSCQTAERLFFVMDFVNGGKLSVHLQNDGIFDERRTAFYAAEIALALQFLHRHAIIYCNLKLSNVLLDTKGHCKLIGFRSSKVSDLQKLSNLMSISFFTLQR